MKEKDFKIQYEVCKCCKERCPKYLIFEHISKIGIDQFEYEWQTRTLPTQVLQAIQLLHQNFILCLEDFFAILFPEN